jgi:hypothetical protein
MQSLFKICISAWLIFLITACENPLDIPLDDVDTKLTLNADVTINEPLRILVTQSKTPLSSGNYKVPKNAIVNLFKDGEYLETLLYNPNDTNKNYGVFKSIHQPVASSEYKIEVLYPGYEKLSVTDRIPDAIKIQSLETTFYPEDYGQSGEATFNLNFQDDPKQEEFYLLYIFYQTLERTGSTGPDSLAYRYSTSNRSINIPETEQDYTGGLIFNDATFNGEKQTIQVNFSAQPAIFFSSNQYKEVNLFFELRRISKNNYLYRKTYSRYVRGANNGFGEPVLVWTNVENGFGIFSSFTRDFIAYKVK